MATPTSKQLRTRASNALANALFLKRTPFVKPTTILDGFRPKGLTYTEGTDQKDGKGRGLTADDYQAAGSCWIVQNERGILGDLAGYGKTKQFIDAMDHLHRHTEESISAILILCKASSIDTWIREIQRWSYESQVYDYRGPRRSLSVFDIRDTTMPCYLVMSYDTFRSDYKLIAEIDWDVVAMDESQTVRAADTVNDNMSQIGERIHLLKPKRRYLITASPIIRHLGDLWNPLRWLGVEEMPWDEFELYHLKTFSIVVNKYTHERKKIVTGATDHGQVRIKTMLVNCMIRRTNEVDLPPVIKQDIHVPMAASEAAEYTREHKRAWIDGDISFNDAYKLRVLTSNSESKFKEADDLVRTAIEAGEKTIIYTQHVVTLRSLYQRFQAYGIAYILGSVSTAVKKDQTVSDRQLMIDKFQNDPQCRVMIATIATAGTSLTLTAANNIIFIDRTASSELNDQAIKRADRIGQTKPVKVWTLKATIQKPKEVWEVEEELDKKIANNARLVGSVVG